jgi:hypothetical protein
MKAILVHRLPVPGLREHLAGLEGLAMRALSLPTPDVRDPAVAAFVELWGEAEALRAVITDWPETASAWLVDEVLPADAKRSWPSGEASPGVRLVSSVHRKPGLERAAFARYWRTRHAEVALSYTIPVWRYSQNVVVESLGPDEGEDGFAVLHFRTHEELAARWTRHPEEARRGAEDAARFMDPSRAWSVTMVETSWVGALTPRMRIL